MKQQDFLGKGWNFPVTFTLNGGEVVMSKGQKNINQSLDVILSTEITERLMHPNFGCNLQQCIYEEFSANLVSKIKDTVSYAILMYEPRIELSGVEVSRDPNNFNTVLINISYNILSTNTRGNKVYPFYLMEANNYE